MALTMGTAEEATSSRLVVKRRFTGLLNSQSPRRDDCPHHGAAVVITSCVSLWWVTLHSKDLLPPLGQHLALGLWLGLLQ